MSFSKTFSHILNNTITCTQAEEDLIQAVIFLQRFHYYHPQQYHLLIINMSIFLCGKGAPCYTTLYSIPILSSPIVVIITGVITASFLVVTLII